MTHQPKETDHLSRASKGSTAQGDETSASDLLSDLTLHAKNAYASFRLHILIVIEELIGRVYQELIAIYLTAVWVIATIALTLLGTYHLVSGIAILLEQLTGSTWAGHTITGLIFLVCPITTGYLIAKAMWRQRVRRLARKFRSLEAEAKVS